MKKFSVKSFIIGALTATIILVPTLALGASTQTIDAIFGKIKLLVNGTAINQETLLYNGTTYLPIRAIGDAIGAKVDYDAKTYTASLTTSTQTTSTANTPNNWGNKTYLLATDNSKITASKIIITNVNSNTLDYVFLAEDGSDILTGNADINGNFGIDIVSDTYSLVFELSGDELLVEEKGSSQLFPDAKATYVHRTIASPAITTEATTETATSSLYTNFKEGTYSSGSSDTAKTLVITSLKSDSFKYQVIAANGKDVITEGIATITSEGNAECKFSDDYTITLTDLKNDVIQLKESKQQLFPVGGIKFYTTA